jgi:hypothetical protein
MRMTHIDSTFTAGFLYRDYRLSFSCRHHNGVDWRRDARSRGCVTRVGRRLANRREAPFDTADHHEYSQGSAGHSLSAVLRRLAPVFWSDYRSCHRNQLLTAQETTARGYQNETVESEMAKLPLKEGLSYLLCASVHSSQAPIPNLPPPGLCPPLRHLTKTIPSGPWQLRKRLFHQLRLKMTLRPRTINH